MGLRYFISSFLKSKGLYVFLSVIITKLISFAISYIAIRILLKETYGYITYANSIISFVVPFMGMGAFQGLIKYGAGFDNERRKFILFNYSLKNGLLLTVGLSVFLYLIAPFVTQKLPGAVLFFRILSFQIIGLTVLEFIKSYFRLINKNHLYAIWEIIYSVSLLFATVVSVYYLGEIAYVIALVSTPFLISTIIVVKYKLLIISNTPLDLSLNFNAFWKYGVIVSAGTVSSQLLYVLDIVMIGNVIQNSTDVALYKAAGLIPLNFRFIPYIFILTDYVKFAKYEHDSSYLWNYFINYLKIFIPVSIILIIVFFFNGDIWASVFGNQYKGVNNLIWIFAISIAAGLILRIPLGNILTATNWAHYNAYVSIGSLCLNIILNYMMISKHGIFGAAWASTITMWVSGIVTLVIFILYLKRQKSV